MGGWDPALTGPYVCAIGRPGWSLDIEAEWDAFARVYSARSRAWCELDALAFQVQRFPKNALSACVATTGGTGISHHFGMWLSVRAVRPALIVESGAYRGKGTWVLRQAAGPDVPIVVLSPVAPRQLGGWVDRSGRTHYMVGANFTDFGEVDWAALRARLGLGPRAPALAFFDDHQSATRRLPQARRRGFLHVLWDDNFALVPPVQRKGLCTSPKMLCDGHNALGALFNVSDAQSERDHFGATVRPVSRAQRVQRARELRAAAEAYVELPPVSWLRTAFPKPVLGAIGAARTRGGAAGACRLVRDFSGMQQRPWFVGDEAARRRAQLTPAPLELDAHTVDALRKLAAQRKPVAGGHARQPALGSRLVFSPPADAYGNMAYIRLRPLPPSASYS